MSEIGSIGSLSTTDLLKNKNNANVNSNSGGDFANKLKNAMNQVNDMQVTSEKAMSDIATGQVKDLAQAAIAIDKAEISMRTMLEVRSKALNAYKEITRTQI